jgi:hypothetical protein
VSVQPDYHPDIPLRRTDFSLSGTDFSLSGSTGYGRS